MKRPYDLLRTRDAAAWDEFYRKHTREVYGFVHRLLGGDSHAAADVFQDTWLDAMSHIERFDPTRGELRSWLFGIARQRVALYWRRSMRERHPIPPAGDENSGGYLDGALLPDEVVENLEQGAVVRAALLALPPERRQALVQKYVEKLSVAQIATNAGSSLKAAESLLSRAREQLRTLLCWYFSDTHCRNKP